MATFCSLFDLNLIVIVNTVLIHKTQTFYTSDPHQRCKYFKHGPNLEVKDMVGIWMTVYTQPKSINCFTLQIRATTELEREQLMIKYGNFSDQVDWNTCALEVQSPFGKHYLQGDGAHSGLLDNVLIMGNEQDGYALQAQSSDQWSMFGRRGSELLLMRDCTGEAVAVFARAPYWPAAQDLYAILHRSGVATLTHQHVLCQPLDVPSRQCYMNHYYSIKKN